MRPAGMPSHRRRVRSLPGLVAGDAHDSRERDDAGRHPVTAHAVRRIFLAGQVTSVMGDGIALLAVPLLVLQLTHDPFLAALAAAVRTAGYLVVGLPAGPLVDRLSAARVVQAADAVRMAAFTVMGVLAWAGRAQVWLILVLAATSACASVFFDAALAVTVQDLFTRHRVLAANASIETASQLSKVLGPAAAAVLATTTGLGPALWLDAGSFAMSLVTVTMVTRAGLVPRHAGNISTSARGSVRREFADGLAYLRRQRLILALTVLFAIANLCLGVDSLLVYLGTVTMHLSPLRVSMVVGAGGVAGVAGAVTAPRLARRLPRVPVVAAAIAVAGLSAAGIGAARSVWSLAAANACLIFATSQAGLLVRSIRQEVVPRELLGRVTAAVRTVFVSATPLGAMLAGAVTGAAGNNPRPVFLASGLVLAVSAVTGWFTALRHHAGYLAAAAVQVPEAAVPMDD
jgi:MFS family permease